MDASGATLRRFSGADSRFSKVIITQLPGAVNDFAALVLFAQCKICDPPVPRDLCAMFRRFHRQRCCSRLLYFPFLAGSMTHPRARRNGTCGAAKNARDVQAFPRPRRSLPRSVCSLAGNGQTFCKTYPKPLDKKGAFRYNNTVRRRSLVVKPQLPKLEMRVRFPSPAPKGI